MQPLILRVIVCQDEPSSCVVLLSQVQGNESVVHQCLNGGLTALVSFEIENVKQGSCEHFGMVARLTPTGFNMMILFAVQTHERLTTRNLLLHKCCNYSRHGASLQVDYLMKRLPTYQCLSQHQLHALLFSSPDTTRNLIKEMPGFPGI